MKKITLTLLMLFFALISWQANAQCTSGTSFGAVNAPTISTPLTISTCIFAGEYNTINNVTLGATYTFSSSIATDFLTLTDGTNAPLVFGTTPITWTASFSGTVRLHVSANSSCATQTTCRTTTVTCTSCPPPPPPANCINAFTITGDGTYIGTTTGSTFSNVGTCVTTHTSGDVWYTFTDSSGTGSTVTINTCAAVGFDTKLSVFSGSCGALVCVTGNDDDITCSFSGVRSQVVFTTDGSSTYYVMVHGFGTATGNFELNVSGMPSTGGGGGDSYIVDFEGPGETKGGYASGTVNLSGLDWNMTDALIALASGPDPDYVNGLRSARMRGYGTSAMTMLQDKSNGLGNISFDYRRYGTDLQVEWVVEYSTDQGNTWLQAGNTFTPLASNDVQTFNATVEVEGNVRIRIRTVPETGTANRRMNIDDIELTDFVAPSSRVQIIHNSADPLAQSVDVYVNDALLLDNFGFRTATPFVTVPAGVPLSIDIAPAGSSSSADSVYNLTATLEDGETYLIIATGVLNPSQFNTAVNSDIDFRLEVYSGAREAASNSSDTDVLVHHGATDAPTVDVVETSIPAGTIVNDISFSEFQGYLELTPVDYELSITTADGNTVVASYFAPLATLGLQGSALTVLASGFLDPALNQNGAAFGLWVALPSGGPLVQLPSPLSCGSIFTDSGGPNGNYSNNEDITWTISPLNQGDFVTVTFTSFSVEANWDALYVYNGPDTNSPLISSGNPPTTSGFPAGGFYGTTIPGPFSSTHPSGALTFRFRSDSSVTFSGWVANVVCSPIPPANDLIQNAISVTNLDQPYTDEGVRLQYATNELLNPSGCNIAGTNGVWYSFTAAYNGSAEASVTSPAGVTAVIFYEAPNENVANETQLTFLFDMQNQCAPSTSSSIPTLAGQSYYIYVLNTGGPSDVVIDISESLGIDDNTIDGFVFYPNPADNVLNLKSNVTIDQVELFTVLGQNVMTRTINAASSQLDISRLSTGVYLMRVTADGQTATYQVIKR